MKLTEQVEKKLKREVHEAKLSPRQIVITVDREMIKGYVAECLLTVTIDEKAKEAFVEKEKASIEKEATEQGKRDEEDDTTIKKNIEKWTADFFKQFEKYVSNAASALQNQNIRVNKKGNIYMETSAHDYPFIACKLTHKGQEIADAVDISDWKYDDGEVAINGESYGSR